MNVFKLFSKSFAALIFIIIATVSYNNNYFSFSPANFYSNFDKSEILVIGRLIAEDKNIERSGWNLGFAVIDEQISADLTYQVFSGNKNSSNLKFSPYKSQLGVQGLFFSAINSTFGKPGIYYLHLINAVIFAIIICALSFLYSKIYDKRFGFIFFVTMVSSPWIVAFAHDLYWVPFTWFLPAVFSALLYNSKNLAARTIFIFGITISIFIKSLAGYEYLTTITLFTCSVFIVAPFFKDGNRELKSNSKMFILAFMACVLGFVCALLVHANMRGDSLLSGLQSIYELDVKRRTYGDPELFEPIFRQSLESSWLENLSIYWSNWATNILEWLPDISLSGFIYFILAGFVYRLVTKRVQLSKYIAMLFVFFLVTISWFVFGKAHSFIHQQLNFVLWYFGFVQTLLYISTGFFITIISDLKNKIGYKAALLASMITVGSSIFLLEISVNRYINSLESGPLAPIDIGDGFKIFFSEDGEVVFFNPDCRVANLSDAFILHFISENQDGNAKVRQVAENKDFVWKLSPISNNFFFLAKYHNGCVHKVDTPKNKVIGFQTGRYSKSKDDAVVVSWVKYIDLLGKRPSSKIIADNISDANWENGISKRESSLVVKNDLYTRMSLSVGDKIRFKKSKTLLIRSIDYTHTYIKINFDGGRLDPISDGYPNELFILP